MVNLNIDIKHTVVKKNNNKIFRVHTKYGNMLSSFFGSAFGKEVCLPCNNL